jgi:hypothetical protein
MNFTVGFDFSVFLGVNPDKSFRDEQPVQVPAVGPAKRIRGFDTWKHLRTAATRATATKSRTTSTLGTLLNTSAITSPPRRQHKPPGLTESELTTSRRRHSSRITMRQDQPSLAVPSPSPSLHLPGLTWQLTANRKRSCPCRHVC